MKTHIIKVSANLKPLFEQDREQFANRLATELSQHKGELGRLLSPYRAELRATVTLADIEEVFVDETGKGVVHCSYVEEIYMGCKDMDSSEEDTAELNFVYIPADDVVCFEVPKRPERNPKDEF